VDLKRRKVIFSEKGLFVGVLAISDTSIVFFCADVPPIVAARSDSVVTWLGGSAVTAYRFDIAAAEQTFRVYLSPPTKMAPRLSRSALDEIGEQMSNLGNLVSFGSTVLGKLGGLGDLASGATVLGDLMALPGAIGDQRTARRNAGLVRERLGI
jgi:hypothetical protein